MVILLDGSSKLGRITIAEQAVEKHPAWKHLALEVIEEASPDSEEKDFHVEVVRRCAQELERDNLHLMLTLPGDSEQYELLSDGLKPNCITIHLGKNDGRTYDYVIDPGTKSVNDVLKFLGTIMSDAG